MNYWVYILASGRHGTLYIGVTNSLERRIAEHRAKEKRGFSRKHDVTRLVWFEGYGDIGDAIYLEKRLKRWRREWKVRLIEENNHDWRDLYGSMMTPPPEPPASMGPGQAAGAAFRDDTPLYSRTQGPRRGRRLG